MILTTHRVQALLFFVSLKFDILMSGEMPEDPAEAREKVLAFEAAGATWWVEEGLGWSLEEFRGRIHSVRPGV